MILLVFRIYGFPFFSSLLLISVCALYLLFQPKRANALLLSFVFFFPSLGSSKDAPVKAASVGASDEARAAQKAFQERLRQISTRKVQDVEKHMEGLRKSR